MSHSVKKSILNHSKSLSKKNFNAVRAFKTKRMRSSGLPEYKIIYMSKVTLVKKSQLTLLIRNRCLNDILFYFIFHKSLCTFTTPNNWKNLNFRRNGGHFIDNQKLEREIWKFGTLKNRFFPSPLLSHWTNRFLSFQIMGSWKSKVNFWSHVQQNYLWVHSYMTKIVSK